MRSAERSAAGASAAPPAPVPAGGPGPSGFWDAVPVGRPYVAIGSVLVVASTVSDLLIAQREGSGGIELESLILLLAAVAFLAQWWRTTAAFVLLLPPMALSLWADDPISVLLVLPFVLGAMLATARSRHFLAAGLGVTVVWSVVVALVGRSGPVVLWVVLPVVGVGVAVGLSLRSSRRRQEADARRLRDAERRAREAAERERRILARDLHDIVAHNLTIISMQASAAEYLGTPEAAQNVLRVVGASARDALTDLRRMLSILQSEGVIEPAPTPGTPETDGAATVAQLGPGAARLAAELRVLGIDATEEVALGSLELNLGVRAALYRVMQESVTNVAKHAGPGEACSLRLAAEGGDVVLEVVNTVPEEGPRPVDGNSSGVGVTSMRDRIEAFGGRLEVGPLPGHRWRVHAAVPVHPPAG